MPYPTAASAGLRFPRRPMLAVLVVAAALRLGAAVALADRAPEDDERAYHEIARSLVAGGGFSTQRPLGLVNPGGGAPTSAWGCLQPLYLAAVYALAGPRPGAAYLVNAGIGLLTVGIAASLGRRVAGARGAVVAGALIAGDVYLVKFTASLLSETVYVALLVGAIGALVAWHEHGDRRLGFPVLAGTLLGLAALARGLAFYLAPLVLAWVVIERRRSGRPTGAVPAVAFLLALAAVIAPWVARNRRVHERPVFLDTKAGWNLYGYLHPDFDPRRGNPVAVPPEVLRPEVSESRRHEILLDRALGFLREDPWRALRSAPIKLGLLWSPFPGRLTDPQGGVVKLAFVLPLELLALVGAVRIGASHPVVRLLYLLIGYHLLVHSVMTGGPRFRVPLDPALAVLAAAALRGRDGGSGDQSRTSPSAPA